MPVLTVEGTWYGGSCQVFSGVYASLGNKSHTSFSIVNIAPASICNGYSFQVRDNTTNTIIYNSTSPAQNVALYFDGNLPPPDAYDCINGTCILKGVYGTPGIYESLEECESSCGNKPMCSPPFECIDPSNFCPPGKICIPQNEWTQIEGLANKLKQKNCS